MASPIEKMMNYVRNNPKKVAASLLVGLSAAALYWLFTPAFLAFAITLAADLISICVPTFISYSFVNAAVTALAYVGIVSFFATLTDQAINFVTRMTTDQPAAEIKTNVSTAKSSADQPRATVDASRDRVYPTVLSQAAASTQTDELTLATRSSLQ